MADDEQARPDPGVLPVSRLTWPAVAVAVGLAVVSLAIAAGALLVKPSGGSDPLEAARSSALAAARDRTEALTTYDAKTFAAEVKAVLATSTGPFRADYDKTTRELRATFTREQAVAVGTVVAAGLESATRDRAVAVVAVDQVIRTKGAAARTERNRLRMTLVRPDDTWLVERVDRL